METVTVAYETAMGDLSAAVEDLHDGSADSEVAAAADAADRAWAAWHEANDYAAQLGVADRTPAEWAALQRRSKLVTRLTCSAAGEPELAAIKRVLHTCLDKGTTGSLGWGDIAVLPAIERAGVLPQLDATAPR